MIVNLGTLGHFRRLVAHVAEMATKRCPITGVGKGYTDRRPVGVGCSHRVTRMNGFVFPATVARHDFAALFYHSLMETTCRNEACVEES